MSTLDVYKRQGSYRAIDFALSNMTNSHIQKVAVLTQYNAWSLNEHLSSSKWWDFGRKQGGLYVFTPSITSDNGFWYRGTADAIAQNIAFLKKSHEPYVIVASADGIYKLDYNDVLKRHIETGADITIVCKDMGSNADVSSYGVVTTVSYTHLDVYKRQNLMQLLQCWQIGQNTYSMHLIVHILMDLLKVQIIRLRLSLIHI